ncbi:hypothetical protein ABLO26_15375 [Neobacillus sp. 179-J 1A1 HS]|uniref:hypothetical protein n=1 Tax=Neobacillus driksii TaxID=3035913 RepID=UPI0035BBFE79
MIKKKIRHIQRYRDIVYTFTKYGFGFVMKELGLLDLLAVPKKVFVEGNKTLNTRLLPLWILVWWVGLLLK